VLAPCQREDTASEAALPLEGRSPRNVAVIFAYGRIKLARIACSVLTSGSAVNCSTVHSRIEDAKNDSSLPGFCCRFKDAEQ